MQKITSSASKKTVQVKLPLAAGFGFSGFGRGLSGFGPGLGFKHSKKLNRNDSIDSIIVNLK